MGLPMFPCLLFHFLYTLCLQRVYLHTCFLVYTPSRHPIQESERGRAKGDDEERNPHEEPADEREERGEFEDHRAADESTEG